MDKSLRIKQLKEIQDKDKDSPAMQGIRINYKGVPQTFPAFQIPLSYLVYNKYNGRIATSIKTYEKEKGELNPEKTEHKEIIEQFLFDSKKDRNEYTMNDIIEKGQRVYGIVTFDGVIIDGNRRAMLLNKIYKNRASYNGRSLDNCQYFLAVILPEGADKRTILQLETEYQMGQDEKLDYNPIEKYLKCKDLIDTGFKTDEIAKMMSEDESKIKEWLEVMGLMEDYLDVFGYNGIYTLLDKTEDLFLTLNRVLQRLRSNGGSSLVTWNYNDFDINELKQLSFDFIRSRYEGKDFRDVLSLSKKGSIFCKSKDLWESFLSKHHDIVNNVKEISVDDMRKQNPGGKLTEMLKRKDIDWKDNVDSNFTENLQTHVRQLQDINERDMPLILISRALTTLKSINTETQEFLTADQVKEKLEELEILIQSYLEKIDSDDLLEV